MRPITLVLALGIITGVGLANAGSIESNVKIDTNMQKSLDVARCAGVTQGMMDNGAIDPSSEPVLVYYGTMMEAVLFAFQRTPQSILDTYANAYATGLEYKPSKYGKLYFECVMSMPSHMF